MKTVSRVGLCVLVALAASAGSARAQTDRKVSLTVGIAFDPSIGGAVTSAGSATINLVQTSINEVKWTDSHSSQAPQFSFDVGLEVARMVEPFVGFEYGRVGADLVTIGTVPTGPLSASFDPYQFWGLEGGIRAGLHNGRGPFGMATVGFRNVSEMSAIFTATNFAATKVFYDNSFVPTFGFGGGYVFGGGSLGLGIEIGAKYSGALKSATESPELSAVNKAGARWSLPVGVILRF